MDGLARLLSNTETFIPPKRALSICFGNIDDLLRAITDASGSELLRRCNETAGVWSAVHVSLTNKPKEKTEAMRSLSRYLEARMSAYAERRQPEKP